MHHSGIKYSLRTYFIIITIKKEQMFGVAGLDPFPTLLSLYLTSNYFSPMPEILWVSVVRGFCYHSSFKLKLIWAQWKKTL